ncbi:septum site-determining protein MinC [Buchnera aphidicola]|uniref:septum site-determining protein MinC n=1 Tax=Buchnera aphidicola TaxID=9 RepID=UPI003463F612
MFAKKNVKNSKIINFPIRSGQKIYVPDGDLIVINNVNAGGEVIASGNIHVYGKINGRALAGARGDLSSHIFCLNLSSELISIAGEYFVKDKIPKIFIGKTVDIFLKDGILKINKI